MFLHDNLLTCKISTMWTLTLSNVVHDRIEFNQFHLVHLYTSEKSEQCRLREQHCSVEARLSLMQTQLTERDKQLQAQKASIERLQREKHEGFMTAASAIRGTHSKYGRSFHVLFEVISHLV